VLVHCMLYTIIYTYTTGVSALCVVYTTDLAALSRHFSAVDELRLLVGHDLGCHLKHQVLQPRQLKGLCLESEIS
jgi:hypothetical protein